MATNEITTMHSNTQQVECTDVFNLPLFSYFFLIDTRKSTAFEDCHIVSSLNFIPPEKSSNEEEFELSLGRLMYSMVEQSMSPLHLSPVVLIADENCPRSMSAVCWLSHRLAKLQTLKSAVSTFSNNTLPTPSRHDDGHSATKDWRQQEMDRLMLRLSALDTEVWFSKGGFARFHAEFPSQCSRGPWLTEVPTLDSIGTTPRIISPHLYIGARDLDACVKTVKTYSITHIICAAQDSFSPRSVADTAVEAIPNVVYLRCTVGDTYNEDMVSCFQATTAFITNAEASGGRVLVFLHGRTRSAAIAAAYLMHTQLRLSATEAFQEIESICKMKYHSVSTSFDQELVRSLISQLDQANMITKAIAQQ